MAMPSSNGGYSGDETPEERKLRHQRLFASIDVDGTGRVNRDMLQRALEKSDHPLKASPEAVDHIFKALDQNKDSVIDFNDFEKYVTTAEAQIKIGFRKIDKDNDGKINIEELSKYLSQFRKDHMTKEDELHQDGGSGSVAENSDKKRSSISNFVDWAFNRKSYITYEQWRDFLLFVPRKEGSRLNTAYAYFYLFNDDVDLSSEGDVTLINDFIKGFGFFIAGGCSGVVSRTCTAPFDRIKVFLIARTDLASTLLNSKDTLLAKNPNADLSKIKSPLIKAATTLYRQGGLRAFYVGNGLNVMKVFPESAIKFGSFEMAKRIMARLENVKDTSELSRLSTYIAGGLAGVCAQFSVYPIDTLKYRIQCAPLNNNLKGTSLLVQTAKEMYQQGGIRLFYRGVHIGVMGIFPYAALDLGTFSALKKWYIKREARKTGASEDDIVISNFVVLPMGAFSGTVGATLVYPINLLRTRLQAQGTYAHPYVYTGFSDVLKKTIQREGYQGLFKGLVPNLAKVCPAVSISYLCYENLKRLMKLE